MKIICPECEVEIENQPAIADMIKCPACGKWSSFVPPPHPPENIVHTPSMETTPEMAVEASRESIRRQAGAFVGMALLVFGIGVLCLLLGIVAAAHPVTDGGDSNGRIFWLLMASAFGLSFWLYLVGQIIHIRANTEK